MLVIEDLHKSYGTRSVLRGVNLSVGAGAIVGLIGANGAGKSTLISIATGLITADSGRVLVGKGKSADVDVAGYAAAPLIGLAPQDLGVYPTLTVRQNLATMGELMGLSRRDVRHRTAEVAGALDLEGIGDQRAATLSGGQARRLHTGMALMHRPAVLFLDEPTVGADVAARRAILAVVRDLADRGTSVVYTTHYLTELSDLGADVAILDGGNIVETGTVAQVVDAHARPQVAIVTSGMDPELAGWIRESLPEGARWSAPPHLLLAGPHAALARALAGLSDATRLVGVEVTPASLETAYLAITGRNIDADSDAKESRTLKESSHDAHA